jgi:mannose/cellobiose epimerase-like protein (N-acyl-D-glucosamine 2-epimerase family)
MSKNERLERLHGEIQNHLVSGLIPFWLARAEDKDHGGFLTNFDEQGQGTGTPEKYLNTQCRLIWTFSHLNRRQPAPEFARLARQGVDFMITHLWDTDHGGFYWKCRCDGSQLDTGKIVYGESFAIYALSEYFLGTGDRRGVDYAGRTFDLLQKHCADTRYGGYLEYLNRDWSPETPGFGGGDRKTLDTHMHLMESFTVLAEASQSGLHRRKLLEVVDLIAARMIDPATGCGLNQFDLAWNAVPALALKRTWNAERFGEQPANPTETTSYGHNVELAWLMRRALDTVGVPLDRVRPLLRRLLDHAVKHGVDWELGGIYRDGLRATGEPLVLEKEFWQHAEALVGFLDGYEVFGDERYLDAFECLWRFVAKYMIIHEVGEWRTLLARDGSPLDSNIGNPWKVNYHTGRAMIECTRRLERLLANQE